MKTSRRLALAVVAFALAAPPLAAHHSLAMFDTEKKIGYEGVVTEWRWLNPHVHFVVDIKAGPGVDPQTVGTWDVECGSVHIMARQGWTRTLWKVGDRIRFVGHPMKDGSKGVSLFYAILPDGRRLYRDIARKDDVKD